MLRRALPLLGLHLTGTGAAAAAQTRGSSPVPASGTPLLCASRYASHMVSLSSLTTGSLIYRPCGPAALYTSVRAAAASSSSSGGGGGGGGSDSGSANKGGSGGGGGNSNSGNNNQKAKKKKKAVVPRKKKPAAGGSPASGGNSGGKGGGSHSGGSHASASTSTGSGGGGGASSSSSSPSASSGAAGGGGGDGKKDGGGSSPSSGSSNSSSSSSSSAAAGAKNKRNRKKAKPTTAQRRKAAERLKKMKKPKRKPKAAAAAAGGNTASSSSSSSGALVPTPASVVRARAGQGGARRHKKIRVCVLNSSYDGIQSATASMDNFWCTPQHWVKKDKKRYTFADASIKKTTAFSTVRQLVSSNNYDVFFNLCDGGRDEERAGIDVVHALEDMNAAFTGTDSHSFEPSKIDMKLLVGFSGVRVPNFVLLHGPEALARKCRHLRFPVIVKHLSGYASVGIHADSRCDNLEQLKHKVKSFVKEFNHALVEEFIRGREGTVLACADAQSPYGIKVFRPLMFHFLKTADDFAYFEKKWTMECNDAAYGFLAPDDPAQRPIADMARNAFRYIMNGVGYGRVDFRIDDRTGEPYFLEINPNCGMWYSAKDGGDFADIMVQGDPTWTHERFLRNAVTRAVREQAVRRPWHFTSHDKNGLFTSRASRTVPEGKPLFDDPVHPVPVVARALYKLGEAEPAVGCVVTRGDGKQEAVAVRHSCAPNMHFMHGQTLTFVSKRQISNGEELTVDYGTLRDPSMPHFACSCGTSNCRGVIFAMPPMPRTIELKAARRMMREKRRNWRQENADRVAERLIRRRSAVAGLLTSASGGSASSSSASASSSGDHHHHNSHTSSNSSSSGGGGGHSGGSSSSASTHGHDKGGSK